MATTTKDTYIQIHLSKKMRGVVTGAFVLMLLAFVTAAFRQASPGGPGGGGQAAQAEKPDHSSLSANPEEHMLGRDHPLLAGLPILESKEPLIANEGPFARYPPEEGKVSYVTQHQRAAENRHFSPDERIAAHKDLPIGSVVRVTRTDTGQSVVVMIKDRGPHVRGRILDLSKAAAQKIGLDHEGVVPGRIEMLAYPLSK